VKRVTTETINVMFGVTPSVAEIETAWKQAPVPAASPVA
jgi:hypothetical protein